MKNTTALSMRFTEITLLCLIFMKISATFSSQLMSNYTTNKNAYQ